MRTYIYEAIREPGQPITGEIQAEERSSAATLLVERGYHVLRIEDADAASAQNIKFRLGLFTGFRAGDLARFTRDLAALLRAGLPLAQSLGNLRSRETRDGWRSLTAGLQAALEDGESFSQSLQRYPGMFDAMYVNLVRAGEEGGTLPATLTRIADVGERREELRSKVKLALVYPLVMVLLGAFTVAILLTLVVPMFSEVFRETGQVLPLPTQILVDVSAFLKAWWWIVFPAAAIAIGLALRYLSAPEGRRLRSTIALALPEVKKVAALSEVATFARTLGILLQNGVSIVRALEVTADTLQNHHYRSEVSAIQSAVHDGDALSTALKQTPHFPASLSSIAAVGEDSGTLPDALLQTANDYDRDLERELKILTTLLEPAMIIVVGGLVGFIVMAIILPIFELGEGFQM